MIKKALTITIILAFVLAPLALSEDRDKEEEQRALLIQKMVDNLVKHNKKKAEKLHGVLVLIEDEEDAVMVLYEDDFPPIKLDVKKQRIGLDIRGADFVQVDKKEGEIVKFRYPRRFRSVSVTERGGIDIEKDYNRMRYTHKIESTQEFIKAYHLRERRSGLDKNELLVNVEIFDYRKKKKDRRDRRK